MTMSTTTRTLWVGDREIPVDPEGYIINLDDWSESFAQALADEEGLVLTDEHWDVICFIRSYYYRHQVQPQVRVMIKHFRNYWGPEKGNNHYLHDLFPRGGPQKQGNRLAGILRTKGEH
ncbi:DsrC family protein [Alkalilimnicola ehrlichii MLHE-1]|uniref:Sulfurtransferase n=2 Tax=Alkalilimnicola ehrlichii TaxID=351052 RepID=Q0A9Y7_ALKEH|nr:DsrC family protein [Alkalilimnicola ehrlichii MLHE-1]